MVPLNAAMGDFQDARPEGVHPRAVLCLLPLWVALLVHSTSMFLGPHRLGATPTGRLGGILAGMAVVALFGLTLMYLLAVVFTWAWLAVADRGGGPRLGLWIAVIALGSPWALHTERSVALGPVLASASATCTVIVAALRSRNVARAARVAPDDPSAIARRLAAGRRPG